MNHYPFGPDVQFKEAELDRMFQECFGYIHDGTFVEVGAYDGKTYSHTWGLATLGWRGVYVEPVPDLFRQCCDNHLGHANVNVLRCAAGSANGTAALFIDENSVCGSTLNPEAVKNPTGLTVTMRTLDSILESQMILPGFELLSIDVEFAELEVLVGFDLGRWLPKMVIIELCEHHGGEKQEMSAPLRAHCDVLFREHGYRKIFSDAINGIFVRP